MTKNRLLHLLLSFTFVLCLLPSNASAQKPSKLEIGQWRDVLKNMKAGLKEYYYDPNLRGIDIEARFQHAEEQMKSAESLNQLIGIAAQVYLDLEDSHTRLLPPYRFSRVDYGWFMQVVGPDCYVNSVKPDSDAAAKGLQVGDRVISIDGRPMDRTKIWLAEYLYNTLQPQPSMKLVIEKPDKRQVELVVQTKLRKGTKFDTISWGSRLQFFDAREYYPHDDDRFHELSKEVLIWKMPRFRGRILYRFEKKAMNRKALILDLRGNPGGYVETLERFTGYFFDSRIKISEAKGRKKFEPNFTESQGKAFKGKLVVLIDGNSTAEAEIFARIVQLEKRGIVIGDRSAGSVMRNRFYPIEHGGQGEMIYGIYVTEADVIMPDGNSLEHVGVTPDELLLPTAQELSDNIDPVLARAAAIVGVKLDAKKAGSLFPYVWKS